MYFISKISDLKEGIDKALIVDPLVKLNERMKDNKCKFSLKKVSESQLAKSIHTYNHMPERQLQAVVFEFEIRTHLGTNIKVASYDKSVQVLKLSTNF